MYLAAVSIGGDTQPHWRSYLCIYDRLDSASRLVSGENPFRLRSKSCNFGSVVPVRFFSERPWPRPTYAYLVVKAVSSFVSVAIAFRRVAEVLGIERQIICSEALKAQGAARRAVSDTPELLLADRSGIRHRDNVSGSHWGHGR